MVAFCQLVTSMFAKRSCSSRGLGDAATADDLMQSGLHSVLTCIRCDYWCCRLAEAANRALTAPAEKVYAMQSKAIATEFPPKIMLQKYREVWPYTCAITVLLFTPPCHNATTCLQACKFLRVQMTVYACKYNLKVCLQHSFIPEQCICSVRLSACY